MRPLYRSLASACSQQTPSFCPLRSGLPVSLFTAASHRTPAALAYNAEVALVGSPSAPVTGAEGKEAVGGQL
jgi:hypothetical protein